MKIALLVTKMNKEKHSLDAFIFSCSVFGWKYVVLGSFIVLEFNQI